MQPPLFRHADITFSVLGAMPINGCSDWFYCPRFSSSSTHPLEIFEQPHWHNTPSLSCPALPCPALPFPTLPYPSVPFPTLLFPACFGQLDAAGKATLPYLTLPYPTLPYPTLPHPTLPYPTLPHPTLPYPTLPYPTLPYPHRTVWKVNPTPLYTPTPSLYEGGFSGPGRLVALTSRKLACVDPEPSTLDPQMQGQDWLRFKGASLSEVEIPRK